MAPHFKINYNYVTITNQSDTCVLNKCIFFLSKKIIEYELLIKYDRRNKWMNEWINEWVFRVDMLEKLLENNIRRAIVGDANCSGSSL